MESQISSNTNVASAAQTATLRGESESTRTDSTQMGNDLHSVAHGAADSMVNPPTSSGPVAATTLRFQMTSGNVDKAAKDLWAAVCIGYKREHDAETPASFHTLSASEKRLIVKRAVDEVFKMDKLRIDGYFNRLTANEDVKPYLKGSISQATRAATEKLDKDDDRFYDKRVYLIKRIDKYGMVFTAETWEMENAKSDLWDEVRNAVSEKQSIAVPESFLLLNHEDRRKIENSP
ncbi:MULTISPECIES: hypothetical protein [Pandoraea]|uniref:hypothetical protein n=1 Tax=Pandoraea TaxID=93217 RepID=UPI001F5DDB53|nr:MULTISPECIES: hypothetical protein [Pandoraea]MCI3207155.1 hypothetical protein [Pandoraea sp. LA3]MDN4585184.1 hypothetical protein [Pandoraea capi]